MFNSAIIALSLSVTASVSLASAIEVAGEFTVTAHNKAAVEWVWLVEPRVTNAYIISGNTVVIQGQWVKDFYTVPNKIAEAWCGVFDQTVNDVYIVNMQNQKIGDATCN